MVFIKDGRSKVKAWEQYINVSLDACNAYVQKLKERNFMTKKHEVPLMMNLRICQIKIQFKLRLWQRKLQKWISHQMNNLYGNQVLTKMHLLTTQLSERLCPVNEENFINTVLYIHTKFEYIKKLVHEQLNDILI